MPTNNFYKHVILCLYTCLTFMFLTSQEHSTYFYLFSQLFNQLQSRIYLLGQSRFRIYLFSQLHRLEFICSANQNFESISSANYNLGPISKNLYPNWHLLLQFLWRPHQQENHMSTRFLESCKPVNKQ